MHDIDSIVEFENSTLLRMEKMKRDMRNSVIEELKHNGWDRLKTVNYIGPVLKLEWCGFEEIDNLVLRYGEEDNPNQRLKDMFEVTLKELQDYIRNGEIEKA